jgi:hypothetical protein
MTGILIFSIIGAQTRFLARDHNNRTLVVAYLENSLKSWPAWSSGTPDSKEQVKGIVDEIMALLHPGIRAALNGHSAEEIYFSYLDAVERIPDRVVRIAFLDSNYGGR